MADLFSNQGAEIVGLRFDDAIAYATFIFNHTPGGARITPGVY
jgi:hypothetical protein